MKFGLCTISARDDSVESVLEAAAAAGYDGIEVWGGDHVGDGSPDRCRRIRRTAADHALELPVYGSYLRPGTSEFADDLDHELTVVDRLDADLIRVWAGEQSYGDHDPDHWEATVDDLTRTAERAAERGLSVTVEKHENTLTETATGARRLLERVDAPNCGLNWQPGFSIPAADLVEEAASLAPLSNNVHVQAAPERSGSTRCPLTDAYFDLERLLEPFRTESFDGYVNVEFVAPDVPFEDAIATDLAYLRSITP